MPSPMRWSREPNDRLFAMGNVPSVAATALRITGSCLGLRSRLFDEEGRKSRRGGGFLPVTPIN